MNIFPLYIHSVYVCIRNRHNADMKSKRERFEIVAGKRVQVILDKLDLLGNCSNRNNYEYESSDVSKMFSAIRDSLKRAELRFEDELSKQEKKKFKF